MSPFEFIREAFLFVKHIYTNRYLLFELTSRDFRQHYVTNIMGFAWAIIDPLAQMLIFWFVFGIGFRSGENVGVPFVAYLITGQVAYIFFQKTLSQASRSIEAYSFLLKKVDFLVSFIPLVKIFSELTFHLIVLGIAMLILIGNGIYPTLYWIQVFYYLFAVSVLLLGLSWLTSSVNLFFPDITNIVAIFLQFFFFLTPIFWAPTTFPDSITRILKLNPLWYIVMGYRDSLLYEKPFWENWEYALYFWSVTSIILLLGVFVFMRLKPHFADVA